MLRHVCIVIRYWQATLMQAMEYRLSFVLAIAANAIDFSIGLLQYALFFTAAQRIGGWDMPQMLAFYGTFYTVFALHFIILYPNLEAINQLVRTGQLDLVLVRPVSAQFLLSFRRLSFEEFGSLGGALLLLAGLILGGFITVTPVSVATFVVAVFFSLCLIYAVFLGLLALTVTLERLENMQDLLWTLFGLCRYPVEVYPRWLQVLFHTLLPVAFITTVPARMLLGTQSPEILLLGAGLSFVLLLAARFFWVRALAGYASAGG